MILYLEYRSYVFVFDAKSEERDETIANQHLQG